MTEEEKYLQEKENAHEFFTANPTMRSAALGKIKLNADGFFHLTHKDLHHKRDKKNQMKRFELLKYLKQILEGMKFYQEYLEDRTLVKVKRNKTILLETKLVRYWAFVAIINDRIRVKVILKKIGEGSIFFWSIIPSWKTRGYKPINAVNLSKGDLKND
jgi:hypothetical protein